MSCINGGTVLPDHLARVVRVLHHRDLLAATSDVELARLCGLSRQTILKRQVDIANYVQSSPIASLNDCQLVDKRILQTYIDDAIATSAQGQVAAILGAIAGYVLRYEVKLLGNVNQRAKIMATGKAFVGLCATVLTRKDNQGTPIHHQHKDANYLLTGLNKAGFVDKLFKRSDSYKSGNYSKRWQLLPLAYQVIELSVNHLLDYIQQYALSTNSQLSLLHCHIPPLICLGKSDNQLTQATSTSITETTRSISHSLTTTTGITTANHNADCHFLVSYQQLQQLSFPSLLMLLNQAEFSSYDHYLAVSLANLGQTDASIGRSYNVFTSLKSAERKALGYINYDISSAIQIISFGLLYRYNHNPELFSQFSSIFSYGFDTEFKQQFRNTISRDLKMPLADVKALLTAYANGSTKDSDKHPLLKSFSEDSDLLRREVISTIAQYEPAVLGLAIAQSKHDFDEKMDWVSTRRLDDATERAKSSVFFFIWTYYEKQIRDAMLSVVPDGIPVHDAIYSRHQVPLEAFEKAILEQTGFEVKVSH
jgi:hypothetical protein